MRSIGFAALLLAGIISAPAAFCQSQDPVSALDQSLLDSEPVEEDSLEDTPAPPPPPAIEKPAAEVIEPMPEYDTALLQGLKKVTAETMVFEAPVNTPISFGTLTITVKKCVKSRPEEQPENTALILIKDQKPGEAPATMFSGWMFSSSPAISALEHPVYDITMLDCVMKKKPKP